MRARAGDAVGAPWATDLVHPEILTAVYGALVAPPTIGQSVSAIAALPGAIVRSLAERVRRRTARPA